ncbi:MAG: hypothetical protein B7Z79_00420 [Thiomonas sp. 20-64-9]|nr:MAG: hypothetical protein B7Z79_00420 [Thiomonas sp. 20-64-9]
MTRNLILYTANTNCSLPPSRQVDGFGPGLMRKRRAAPSFLIPLGGPDANAAGLGALKTFTV